MVTRGKNERERERERIFQAIKKEIFSLYSFLPLSRFTRAMEEQGTATWDEDTCSLTGFALMAVGALLVLSSTWALGWTNTFLGERASGDGQMRERESVCVCVCVCVCSLHYFLTPFLSNRNQIVTVSSPVFSLSLLLPPSISLSLSLFISFSLFSSLLTIFHHVGCQAMTANASKKEGLEKSTALSSARKSATN